MTLDSLLDAIDAARVPYALIGAAARNAWAPPRATTDLDFAAVVDVAGYGRVVRELARLGYAPVRSHRTQPSDPVPAVTIFRNEQTDRAYRQVDLLAAATEFEREAVLQAVERRSVAAAPGSFAANISSSTSSSPGAIEIARTSTTSSRPHTSASARSGQPRGSSQSRGTLFQSTQV